jgi:phosphoribosyl 1,2-cyclic phosphodiesterase
MKLTFLGTRGEIERRTRRHFMHTSLMVGYRGRRVMIDCGDDWLFKVKRIRPPAIVVTHAHPDHVGGLRHGVDCPVYATADAWTGMQHFPIRKRRLIAPRQPFRVQGILFEAFQVEHSLRAPAVGYRIRAGSVDVFYSPDVVFIYEREAALRGARLYIGDGATVVRSFVRRRGARLFGHSSVSTQLGWCEKENVPEMIVTHCGTQIVGGNERKLRVRINAVADDRNVRVRIAYDGMELVLR